MGPTLPTATLNRLEILISKVCCFFLSPPNFYGLAHVKKQSIRQYYVLESFYQFDQPRPRTLGPGLAINMMFLQTVYLFVTYSFDGCNFE